MRLRKIVEKIGMAALSVPKTAYVNFKYLPFKTAIRFPICVAYHVRIEEFDRTDIRIDADPVKTGMIRFGLSKGSFYKGGKSLLHLNGGQIRFKGKAAVCGGFAIVVDHGKIEIGDHFFSNANLLLNCSNGIEIGDQVLLGWNCSLLDGNGHEVISGTPKIKGERGKRISVGSHVWLAAESVMLNGSSVSDGSIVSYGSVVHGEFKQKHSLIAGNPAKAVKENIDWKE